MNKKRKQQFEKLEEIIIDEIFLFRMEVLKR
jgi:hypothetical protein